MVIVNSREQINTDIVKGARLESTINNLFNNFEAGEQRNADLINRFFNQKYFKGEESLIDKITEIDPSIDFDGIKDEGINIAILLDDNLMWDFKGCIDKLSDEVKKALIKQIHDKVQLQTGTAAPYDHFDDPNQCGIITGDTNVLAYFQKILDYLNGKENSPHGKKTIEILKKTIITNNDLNSAIPTGEQIPAGISLNDPTIPSNTKNSFDVLLSFEIGKEADRTISIAENITGKLEGLFTNSFPAINTIVGENDEYKYDESKLGDEYQGKVQAISDDTNLSEDEKNKKINDLKREYYIKYLKTKNSKLGDALEQLYNNDFDYSKVEPHILQGYLDKVANIRLKTLYTSGIIDTLGLNWGNFDQFADFYKKLVDKSETEIHLRPGMDLPIEKEIAEGKNEWLKDIDEFGMKGKSYDALPIRFKIKKSDIDSLPIDMDDRVNLLNFLSKFKNNDENYIIEGDDVGRLIYLFFIINSRTILTKFNLDKQQEVESLFGKAKSHKEQGGEDDEDTEGKTEEGSTEEGSSEKGDGEEGAEGDEEYNSQKFREDIEKLGPGKFKDGSEIWMPAGESELPGGGYQWMKIKISNVDMKKGTFTGTVFGGELKFSKYEGKSREFKMDKDTLEQFKQISNKVSGSYNNVFLQPNPDNSNFNSFKDGLNGKIGTNTLTFPMTGVTWDGDKFVQKIIDENGKEKDVEVKYFGASSDDKSTYKIDYNPIRRSFTVTSSFNGDEKGKDGKIEKKRFSYKRDMDRNNFLIFFTQKGLTPQTEEESNDAVARQDQEFKMLNGGHWKLNWFSINNIKNVFKTIKGNIKKKMDDYNKTQDEKLQDILIGDWGLYSKLANVLGFIPSIKDGLGELEQEYYNERDNRTRKKIEYYLKKFQADPDFGTTFDQVPPHSRIQGGKSLQEIVLNRVKNATDKMGDPGIYQAAALLLANFEKGGSPYRGLSAQENTGLWVKALLGKAHYEQFLRDKAACIRDRDLAESSKNSGLDKKGLNEALARCEMDYIINNIRGSYGKLPYFGSHENRGIPNEDRTNYVDNPSKRLLSDQFANKLESASKGRFTKSSVEEAYGKNKSINNFEVMEDEFSKMGSSRYQKGAGALRRMFDLASDESLKKRAKRHFLTFLLSGALDINCDPGLKKQVYGRAKPMSFVPGMLVKEAGVAENIAILLDDATKGDFSKNVKKYFHRDGQLKEGPDFKGLQGELSKWLTDEKMDELDDYFSKLPTNNFSHVSDPNKKRILEKFKKSLIDEDVEEFDRGLLDNPTIVNNGLLTNINVVSDRLRIEDGEFKGKDSDDINNKKTFWKNIQESVSKLDNKNPEIVNFVLNKYFSRFGLNSTQDRQKAYQRITTAYYWRDKIGQPFTYDYNGKGQELDMGTISSTEIDDIIRYTFQGTVMKDCFSARKLPAELVDALEAFQHFFKNAFYNGILQDPIIEKGSFRSNDIKVEPLLLGSRSLYKDVFSGDTDNIFDDTVISEDKDAFKDKKQRRKAQKRAFQSGRFINHEIAQIEKSFKNRLPKTSYRVITQDSSSDIETRIKWLNAS